MRTFCISLPETVERRAKAKSHFDNIGLDVEFIYGINAETAGLVTTHPYEVDNPGSGYIMLPKHVGLCLSHYMIWQICLSMKEDRYLILEDDALFYDDWFPRLEKALVDTPADADILMIGHCNATNKPKTHIKGEIYDLRYPQCTQAYVVYQKALIPLLEQQRDIWAHIDLTLIFKSFPYLNVYTVLPRIVDQRDMDLIH